MSVRIGYFENFKSANTILVSGDEDGLQGLAVVLRTLEDPNARPVELHLLRQPLTVWTIEAVNAVERFRDAIL